MESVGGTDGQGLVVLKLLYFFVHVEFVEVLLGLSFTSTGRLGDWNIGVYWVGIPLLFEGVLIYREQEVNGGCVCVCVCV